MSVKIFGCGNGAFADLFYGNLEQSQEKLQSFPDPSEFSAPEEYQARVEAWKSDVLKMFSSRVLPCPVSYSFHRPVRKNNVPWVPSILGEVLSGNAGDPDEVLLKQRRNEFRRSFFLRKESSWQSLLIPYPPDPSCYDTLEDFVRASKAWMQIGKKDAEGMRHPSEMGRVLDVGEVGGGKYRVGGVRGQVRDASEDMKPWDLKCRDLPQKVMIDKLFKEACLVPRAVECKFASSLPFPVNGAPQTLVNLLTESSVSLGNAQITVGIQKAKAFGDPEFCQKELEKVPKERLLVADMSPARFANKLSKLSHKGMKRVTEKFAWLLPQMHLTSDNRLLCRMFLTFQKLVADEPEKAFEICFSSRQSINNTTLIVALFHIDRVTAFKDEKMENEKMDLLLANLLMYHLARRILVIWSNKKVMVAINKYIVKATTAIEQIVQNTHDFVDFANELVSGKKSLRGVTTILRVLVEFNPTHLFKLFSAEKYGLFKWLSVLYDVSHEDFGAICTSVISNSDAQKVFVTEYVRSQMKILSVAELTIFAKISGFVSLLFERIVNSETDIAPSTFNICFSRACHMLPIRNVSSLIKSLCQLYAARTFNQVPGFVENYFDFRCQLLTLFEQFMETSTIIDALDAIFVMFLLEVPGTDKSGFASLFLVKIVSFMDSSSNRLIECSASMFRNWVYNEMSVLETLLNTPSLKKALESVFTYANDNIPLAIQLILLFYGYTNNLSGSGYDKVMPKRKRKHVRELLFPIIVEQKFEIARVHSSIINRDNLSCLSQYAAEIHVLKHVWEKRGTYRNTSKSIADLD